MPYWLSPKNRAKVFDLVLKDSGTFEVVYTAGHHENGMDPSPMGFPGMSGIKIEISKTEVPNDFWGLFQLDSLKFVGGMESMTEVVCMIEGACKGGNPDKVDEWEAWTCEGKGDCYVCKICEGGAPDSEEVSDKPDEVTEEVTEKVTEEVTEEVTEPNRDGKSTTETDTVTTEAETDTVTTEADIKGCDKCKTEEPDTDDGDGEEECYCHSKCDCDDDGSVKMSVLVEAGISVGEDKKNKKKRNKRDAGNSLTGFIDFVRSSSCKDEVECREAYRQYLRN